VLIDTVQAVICVTAVAVIESYRASTSTKKSCASTCLVLDRTLVPFRHVANISFYFGVNGTIFFVSFDASAVMAAMVNPIATTVPR